MRLSAWPLTLAPCSLRCDRAAPTRRARQDPGPPNAPPARPTLRRAGSRRRASADAPSSPTDNAWNRDVSADPVARELGRAARRDVAGERGASRSGHDGGVLRHSLHRRAGRISRSFRSSSAPTAPITRTRAIRARCRSLSTSPIEGGSSADPEPGGRRPARAGGPAGRLRALRALQRRAHRERLPGELVGALGLKVNATRPAGWTSADAAGLPILPGLLRTTKWPPAASLTRSASPSRTSAARTWRPPATAASTPTPPCRRTAPGPGSRPISRSRRTRATRWSFSPRSRPTV